MCTSAPRRPGPAGAQGLQLYFLSASPAGMTVPPLAEHFFSDISIQPLPLQPFCPLQALSAPLQPPLPLQALTPWQWTPASFAEATIGAAVVKNPATAAAMSAPLAVMRISSLVVFAEAPPSDEPERSTGPHRLSAVLRPTSDPVTAEPARP